MAYAITIKRLLCQVLYNQVIRDNLSFISLQDKKDRKNILNFYKDKILILDKLTVWQSLGTVCVFMSCKLGYLSRSNTFSLNKAET